MLQLADAEAGNNNNFNYTNALMKEMLSQKLITSKDYRGVPRKYFHIQKSYIYYYKMTSDTQLELLQNLNDSMSNKDK